MTDEEIAQLDRAIRRQRIGAARRMDPIEKLFAGADLFQYACETATAAIRNQNPDWTEEQIRAELRRRLANRERREAEL